MATLAFNELNEIIATLDLMLGSLSDFSVSILKKKKIPIKTNNKNKDGLQNCVRLRNF